MVSQSFDEIASVYDEDIYPLNEKEFVNPTVEVLAELTHGKKDLIIQKRFIATRGYINPVTKI